VKTTPRQLGLRRFSAVELLVTLGLLFVFLPFVDDMKGGDLITSILLSLVLLAAVLAVGRRGPGLIFPALLASLAIAGRGINHFRPDLLSPAAFLIPGLILIAYVVVHLLGFVLNAPQVDTGVLCASVSAYLLLGVMWTMAYWLVALVTPNAFAFNTTTGAKESMQGFNAFYFSLVTLSTVGYGDITPVSKLARILAALEAMTGLLYIAVLIARLVSVYSSRQARNS
jgi:Ion channel